MRCPLCLREDLPRIVGDHAHNLETNVIAHVRPDNQPCSWYLRWPMGTGEGAQYTNLDRAEL